MANKLLELTSKLSEKLKEKKVPSSTCIHVQALVNAFLPSHTSPHGSDQYTHKITENTVQLIFQVSIQKGSLLSVFALLRAIYDPVNCVSAASAKFTPNALPGIEISVTVTWTDQTKNIDRDRDARNELSIGGLHQIDNSFAEANLRGNVLKAAQAAQLLMINNHRRQPLLTWFIEHEKGEKTEDDNAKTVIRACNVDSIDIRRLALLQEKNPNITDIAFSLGEAFYEILFTIDPAVVKGAVEPERHRKRYFFF